LKVKVVESVKRRRCIDETWIDQWDGSQGTDSSRWLSFPKDEEKDQKAFQILLSPAGCRHVIGEDEMCGDRLRLEKK
jgi:hypothetical protein